MLIAVACFIAVFGIFISLYWLFVLRPEGDAERTLARRLNPTGGVRQAERLSLLKRVAPVSIPALERVLRQFSGIVRPLERVIEQSGLRITVGHVVLGSVLTAATAGLLTWKLTDEPLIAFGTAVLFSAVPYLLVRHAARRRINKFEEQFPEAIDLIARALRAGHALTTGLGMVADEVSEPVRGEFRLLHDRQNYGMPLGDALKGFAERVPLLDARFFVTAVLTQREAGGNLSEVLDSLAALIRDRFRLKREVRTLSAHGRFTGWVLGLLPPALTGILFALAPAHISKLFTDPIGIRMVCVALVLQVIGVLIMRRIINIEI
jgi:tight adherence protein B